jgi:non-lysosomal glucosylceramidase
LVCQSATAQRLAATGAIRPQAMDAHAEAWLYLENSLAKLVAGWAHKRLLAMGKPLMFLAITMGAAFAQSNNAQSISRIAGDDLAALKFKNSGIVRSEMHFGYLDQPVEYSEDVEYWNVTRRAKYLYQIAGESKTAPPTGMRSAVPLGGLGSGTVELRADGSFQDWNIFNNSPAGGTKVRIDDAFLAAKIIDGKKSTSWTLRTQPPSDLPAIAQIEYSGAFPVSRLKFSDPDCPIGITLYAYSEFHPHNSAASATPAILFTFVLSNPTSRVIDATLLFNLPNQIHGKLSGLPVTFSYSGQEPTSGELALRASGSNSIYPLAASSLHELWSNFSNGREPSIASDVVPRYGALAAQTSLAPHQDKLVTYVLAWYFPFRPFKNQIPGNYYTRLYKSADDVAEKTLSRLPETWKEIGAWQQAIFSSSLPEWLQDSLVNSVATLYKTGMRFSDGRWRQWESFSCAGLDPVHIDFYRILPYAFLFPDLQKQLFLTHIRYQQDDGAIHEQLTQGCYTADSELDDAGGRVMGDSASDMLLEAWQIYSWTGDKAFLDSVWPNLEKAAEWQIHRSEAYGLPQKLENTYDWWQFGDKDIVSYNAFLYLGSMAAAEKIATVESSSELAERYHKAFVIGQTSLEQHFWTGHYYRSWWLSDKKFPDALHADTLYGQLWAFILDLGLVADEGKMRTHLESESRINGSPYGLKVMRRADPEHAANEEAVPVSGLSVPSPRDNEVWQSGSFDWTSLSLYLGSAPSSSLPEAEKIVRNWKDRLRDQWDYTDTTTGWNGDPWCNSHYARQLIAWSIPLALSGQHYYAPEGKLSFDPKVSAPSSLLFFTPTAVGRLELLTSGQIRLTIDSGHLDINELRVGKAFQRDSISLGEGQFVELNK